MSAVATALKAAASKAVIRTLDLSGQYGLLARLCARYVRVIGEDGALLAVAPEKSCRHTSVLALDAERFRGELELLGQQSDIRFLAVSWGLLEKLMNAFIGQSRASRDAKATITGRRQQFVGAPEGSRLQKQRARYRVFLYEFLPHLYDLFGIEAITSTDSRFRRQMDIGRVSSELGVPYICLYREGLYMVPANYQLAVDRHRKLAPFHIDIMAVQNEVTRDMLLASGAFEPDTIVVRGCPRMDEFLRTVSSQPSFPRTKQLVVFSAPGTVIYANTRFDLLWPMLVAMRAVARVAVRRPDVRVVIKFKDQHLKEGTARAYEVAIREEVGTMPKNIVFNTQRMAAQEVILNSTVVCAMQSTVVLEAAVAGRPVILPHFQSVLDVSGARETLMYIDDHHLFDVPARPEEMERLLLDRLEEPHVDSEIMAGRRALFERYVSPLDASATRRSLKVFREAIAEGSRRRSRDGGRTHTSTP